MKSYITTKDVCQIYTEKFKVGDPEEYSLFLFIDETWQQLAEDTYPQKARAAQLTSAPHLPLCLQKHQERSLRCHFQEQGRRPHHLLEDRDEEGCGEKRTQLLSGNSATPERILNCVELHGVKIFRAWKDEFDESVIEEAKIFLEERLESLSSGCCANGLD
ncbi:hypothetical protein P7K49_030799 [Saguinus oedipus]|uniref:Ras-associating domain-containing protein n=1 Tax=Saguinus oedipus TaxID=9490 RepID=A0ABQ9U413_SAGOE|nr:hypothetical protein P7K49_030799 [Saguinus oedipus]